MKSLLSVGALFAAAASVAAEAGCAEEGGNWYCNSVQAISYSNFGTAGQFKKVSMMANGVCNFEDHPYSGGMAPFDEEISWHFRGPMKLKQFAFYTPGSSSEKRSAQPSPHERRHGHKHFHERSAEDPEKRNVGDWVTATINGQVASWINTFGGETPAPAAPGGSPAAPAYEPSAPLPSINAGAGNWGRQGYYNAEQGVADGIVFLNNMGGQGSGVFDYVWGNSLAYANADNSGGSASPQVMGDILLGDNSEFAIFTDKPCNGECNAVRDGTVAYHGFSGETKLFLLEFSMPLSGKTGFNADMSAIWVLNADIPRTQQYGDCSCWKSGCGEFDIFEILDPGNQKCKSTWHGLNAKGNSNWFQRPIDGFKKAAVILDGVTSQAHIMYLPDDVSFDTTIADTTVAAFLNSIVDTTQKIAEVLPS